MISFRNMAGLAVLTFLCLQLYAILFDNRSAKELAEEARVMIMEDPLSDFAMKRAKILLDRAYRLDPGEAWNYIGFSQYALHAGYRGSGSWLDGEHFDRAYLEKAYNYAWTAAGMNRELPMAQAYVGKLYLIYGDYAEAEKHLRKAIATEPGLFEANYYAAQLYMRTERFEQAHAAIARAEKSASGNRHEALVFEARKEIALYSNDFELADSYYRKIIENSPMDAYSYGNYGVFLRCTGKLEQAEQMFEKALAFAQIPNYANQLDKTKLLRAKQRVGLPAPVPFCHWNRQLYESTHVDS